jgi:hypothetical protein
VTNKTWVPDTSLDLLAYKPQQIAITWNSFFNITGSSLGTASSTAVA